MRRWDVMKRLQYLKLLPIGFILFMYLYYKRSLISSFIEVLIKILDLQVKFDGTREDAYKKIERSKIQEQKKYELPRYVKLFAELQHKCFRNMETLYFNEKENPEVIIFYIHGGGYIERIGTFQWLMLNRIIKKTDAMAIIPLYPLIPATHKESYDLLTDLYKEIIEKHPNSKIVSMGDSAGGGLALGLAEDWGLKKISQPDELILMSPYVNVAFSQENTYLYEKVDPMLGIAEAKAVGEYWAGDLDYNNYRISPINGNLSVLKKVSFFVGTREIMYPDILELYKKLQNQNIPVALYVGKGQNHVYPAIPTLEGRIAIKQIIKIINS